MKPKSVNAPGMTMTDSGMSDYSKLASLLALATGAVAMPQTSNADVIFTDLSSSPAQIGHLSNPTFLINNLPGTARMGFRTHSTQTVNSSRWVILGQSAGYVRFKTQASFVIANNAGVGWDQITGNASHSGSIGAASNNSHFPNSYNHKYLAFEFKDSTQGNAMRYGWIDASLVNNATGDELNVIVYGYAYDDSGAQIAMGFVPEPSSMAFMAMGLGAVGLRKWRRQRASRTSQS